MNDPNKDFIPVAELVPPPAYGHPPVPPKPPGKMGCILGGIFVVLVLSVIVAVVGLMVYQLVIDGEQTARAEQTFRGQDDLFGSSQFQGPNELGKFTSHQRDFSNAKVIFDAGPSQDHIAPRFFAFADALQEACDDTANDKIRALIDYRQYALQATDYTAAQGNRLLFRDSTINEFRQMLFGPIPFSDYQIIKVQRLGAYDYAIYTTSRSVYGHIDPVVWWVTDKDRNLKLYDWMQLEFGLRNSHETATIYLAAKQGGGLNSYERYYDLSREYIDVSNELGPERDQNIENVLSKLEKVNLPKLMNPSTKYITALRWYHEANYERTLNLLKRIDPNQVPGRKRLEGDCYLMQGKYRKAIASYQLFQNKIGQNPESLEGIIACYQHLNIPKGELDSRLKQLQFEDETYGYAISRMMVLAGEQNVDKVFEAIQNSPSSNTTFARALQQCSNSPFAEKYRTRLIDFLEGNTELELPLRFAKVQSQIQQGDVKGVPDRLAELSKDDVETRDMIWSSVAEQGKLVDVFQQSSKSQADFDVIQGIYWSYDYEVDSTEFQKICQIMVEKNPENLESHLDLARASITEEDYPLALGTLNRGRKLIDKDTPEQSLNRLYQLLVEAMYESGQREEAMELAKETKAAASLIRLKITAKDYKDLETLAEYTDNPEDFEHLPLYQEWESGSKDTAIKALAKIAKQNEENFDYPTSNQYLLIEWCEKQGTPLKAYELTSASTIFQSIFDSALAQKDFESCKKLLKMSTGKLTGEAEMNTNVELAWQQKNYSKVISSTELDQFSEWANHPTLEYVVKSAIRTNQLDVAEKYAKLDQTRFDLGDLKATVLLKQKKYKQVATFINENLSYRTHFFLTSPEFDIADSELNQLGPDSHRRL
jgi:tetratricopeptide (TPR) repeat protein